ncbi:hypothetical protein, partial [uncultured Rikenella sp.]|uniref:hypothetical protein n=1 Tax=uncultured Rikenella sp. TaxID=368003 RepID=UPI00262CD28A
EPQEHSPKHCAVSASLRLRYRSAAFSVARWDFISILLSQNKRNPSLSGRATNVCAKFVVRAPCAIHSISAHRRNS